MCPIILSFMLFIVTTTATVHTEIEITSAFDNDLYERVIDDQKCEEQLEVLTRNFPIALEFIDSSGKIPNGILQGNLADLGNYHQCLGIDYLIDESHIEGKYCMLQVPLSLGIDSNIKSRFSNVDNYELALNEKLLGNLNHISRVKNQAELLLNGRTSSPSRASTPALALSLGTCVPKVCRSTRAYDALFNTNLTVNELYCRLPNDKPMSTADYVAIGVFSVILFLTVVHTSYTLYQVYILKTEFKKLNPIFSLFSAHTNSVGFLYSKNSPGMIECMDGIRAISMLWVVVGHTYFLGNYVYLVNGIDILTWLKSFTSVWINSAPLAVDTFLTLSGILCVYTVIGKISRINFLKTLHIYYLNRLLRMFPLLATLILLQSSVVHRLSDGPNWTLVASETEQCRMRWWGVLFHVQNYVRPFVMCLGQTWYLSVDIQLCIVSPIVLVWLFGNRVAAWCSLAAAVLISLILTTSYSFIYDFPGSVFNPSRTNEADYMTVFYANTLTRAAPFVIGMVYGYIMQQLKDKKLHLKKVFVAAGWIISSGCIAFCICIIYPVLQPDHQAQVLDNFLNSYMRSIWAAALGWLIFACHRGYGGPINWFLSHDMWKIPARLSYAMFLCHYPVILVANGSLTSTYYFTDGNTLYKAMSDIMFTFGAALVVCILIDSPFAIVVNILLGKGKKTNRKPKSESQTNIVNNNAIEDKTS